MNSVNFPENSSGVALEIARFSAHPHDGFGRHDLQKRR
jgi:hypothetical protein